MIRNKIINVLMFINWSSTIVWAYKQQHKVIFVSVLKCFTQHEISAFIEHFRASFISNILSATFFGKGCYVTSFRFSYLVLFESICHTIFIQQDQFIFSERSQLEISKQWHELRDYHLWNEKWWFRQYLTKHVIYCTTQLKPIFNIK